MSSLPSKSKFNMHNVLADNKRYDVIQVKLTNSIIELLTHAFKNQNTQFVQLSVKDLEGMMYVPQIEDGVKSEVEFVSVPFYVTPYCDADGPSTRVECINYPPKSRKEHASSATATTPMLRCLGRLTKSVRFLDIPLPAHSKTTSEEISFQPPASPDHKVDLEDVSITHMPQKISVESVPVSTAPSPKPSVTESLLHESIITHQQLQNILNTVAIMEKLNKKSIPDVSSDKTEIVNHQTNYSLQNHIEIESKEESPLRDNCVEPNSTFHERRLCEPFLAPSSDVAMFESVQSSVCSPVKNGFVVPNQISSLEISQSPAIMTPPSVKLETSCGLTFPPSNSPCYSVSPQIATPCTSSSTVTSISHTLLTSHKVNMSPLSTLTSSVLTSNDSNYNNNNNNNNNNHVSVSSSPLTTLSHITSSSADMEHIRQPVIIPGLKNTYTGKENNYLSAFVASTANHEGDERTDETSISPPPSKQSRVTNSKFDQMTKMEKIHAKEVDVLSDHTLVELQKHFSQEFPRIQTEKEMQTYVSIFNADYDFYRKWFGDITTKKSQLDRLDSTLRSCGDHQSEEYKESERRVMEIYNEVNNRDYLFIVEKVRVLHAKLALLKKRICEYKSSVVSSSV